MITSLKQYLEDVDARGTDEAKLLLSMEAMIARTEAKALISMLDNSELDEDDATERLTCLLICHRSIVLANFMMERARGVPMNIEGPVVVPTSVMPNMPNDTAGPAA